MASVVAGNFASIHFVDPCVPNAHRDQNEFPIIIDYSWSIDRMVNAGNYYRVNEEIFSKFPVNGKGFEMAKLRLVHFQKNLSISFIEDRIAQMGFSPARIEHLLVFGYMYPEQQLEHAIIALGSKWEHPNGSLNAPILNGFNRTRSVGLYLANEFAEHHGCRRFLVIE